MLAGGTLLFSEPHTHLRRLVDLKALGWTPTQCSTMARGNGVAAPGGPRWSVGEGIAIGMLDTVPPFGHLADCTVELKADGTPTVSVGTAEFGNGTTTVHAQIAATELGTSVVRVGAFG